MQIYLQVSRKVVLKRGETRSDISISEFIWAHTGIARRSNSIFSICSIMTAAEPQFDFKTP